MNVRALVFVGIAAVLAVVLALMARTMFAGGSSKTAVAVAEAPVEAKVLVAAVAMPFGHIVTPESVKWQPWPKKGLQESYFVEGKATIDGLVGKVVRYSITPGEVITTSSLVGQGERGFLAAILTPGMRAVTVSINDTSGVAGFVFPGDRVDLVMTHDVSLGNGLQRAVSETVLTNVRVLAVDQNTNDQSNEPMKSFKNVTLEVTPKLVEKISVMQRIGQLSLSLRSLAGSAPAAAAEPVEPSDKEHTFTLDSEVTKFLDRSDRSSGDGGGGGGVVTASAPSGAAAPARPRGPTVTVARGADVALVEVGGGR
jgi:pilus assembly protein CpaB